jgi:small subunit ribosomal protein S1
MKGMPATDLLAQDKSQAKPGSGGGKHKGKVIGLHGPDVFVEVPGGRSQGLLPLEQFDGATPKIGDEVDVSVEGYDAANGLLRLSRQGSVVHVDWSSVAEGQVVEARVTDVNKGGLAVEVNGIRGFMPISQIDMYRVEQPEQFVNQRLRCVITEVSPEEKNLVVSRRTLLEREREEQREKLWAELAEGQIRTGTVRAIKPFGIFVDLGGADGLVPVSEMSWARVADPSQLVSLGQSVQVAVTRLDTEARKIGLSLRQLQSSPWDAISQSYPVGVVTPGKVTRIQDFGAFVELEPGIEGLIHVSELAPQRVRRVRDVVQEGQDVQVMVLSVDPAQRRIALSLKAAQAKAQAAVEEAEEEDEGPAPEPKPERPRNYQLRGGMGG